MRSNLYRARHDAWEERNRQILEAGLLSERFPEVSSIVVTMQYTGGRSSAVQRTLSFYPGNPAFFKISSMGEGRDEEGLDLTYFIHRMVRSHEKSGKGAFTGRHKDPMVGDQSVDYQVAITYS